MAIFGDSYQQAIIDEPRQPNDKPAAGFMDLSTTNEDCRSKHAFRGWDRGVNAILQRRSL